MTKLRLSKSYPTNHLLTNMWDRILDGLAEGRTAISLVAVDFSKAFNRMNHDECLRALAEKGASTESIKMIAAFLGNRTMRMRVGATFSSEREVTGGASQGTKMGNFLFTITIEKIEEETQTLQQAIPPSIVDDCEDDDVLGLRRLAREVSVGPVTRFNSGVIASTPYKVTSQTDALRYDDELGRFNGSAVSNYDHHEAEEPELAERVWVDKFVDDVTGGQELRIDRAIIHITTSKEERLIHAAGNQKLYDNIVGNSDKIGMKVNGLKTQLLCINPSNSCSVKSYINIDGKRIISGERMKILGFVFGPTPDAREHLSHVQRKFAARAWSIRHLKKAKIPEEKLVKIYCALIRPVIDYACQVFYHLLGRGQIDVIERFQRRILKIIYGQEIPYSEAIDRAGLPLMEDRMKSLVDKFTKKTAENPRYSHWFPKHREYVYGLRNQLEYREDFAATERQRNGPIFRMRRILNGRD